MPTHLLCAMSSTFTTTAESTLRHRLQANLSNYEIHHSGAPPAEEAAGGRRVSTYPSVWGLPYRRVPPFRPIARERDQGEVRVYTSGAERLFIGTMFTGVFVNAVSEIFPPQS